MKKCQKIIIVGGGFGGLSAAKELVHELKPDEATVTLVDQRNYHLFQPLLYQVATAGLDPSDIAVPIRAQFSGVSSVNVLLARAQSVDLEEDVLLVGEQAEKMHFDYLILACGAQHSYFGKNEWEMFAPGLKTVEQATEIRRRILSAFEFAENETNAHAREALMTFVVIGGGPTGVELAGAIADISRTVLVRDFRNINSAQAHVILVESGPRILPSFSEKLSKRAKKDLELLGVKVRTSSHVTGVNQEGVQIGEQQIRARTILWAAGVQAAAIGKTLGMKLDRSGRVPVEPDLAVPQHSNVFVIGDLAHFDMGGGKTVPGLAQAAIQQGHRAAANIVASIRDQKRSDFHYTNKGQMATIGKRKAIAEMGRLRIGGYPAWMAWLFVHVLYLVGFRNRVAVLLEWTWSYLFSKRGSRLITTGKWRQNEIAPSQPQRLREDLKKVS